MQQNKVANSERMFYVDVLNVIACYAVIVLHCNGNFFNFTNDSAWFQSLFAQVMCFWAVPIFMMCTGIKLIGFHVRYDTKTFLLKRFTRIVIPWLFWSLLYLVYRLYTGVVKVEILSAKYIINGLMASEWCDIYYFIIWLMGVYIAMPALSRFAHEETNRKSLWYMVSAYFIFVSVLPSFFTYLGLQYNTYLSIPLVGSVYLFYAILGYLLNSEQLNKKQRITLYIAAVISVVVRCWITYYFSLKDGILNWFMMGYEQYHCVFLTIAVFIFIKNINWSFITKNKLISKIILSISSCGLGIYLVHIMVMQEEYKGIVGYILSGWKWRAFAPFTVWITSFAIVYVLKKIPLLRKIVP